MKQISAPVISNDQLVSETLRYPRNTLGSYLLWLRCPEIASEARPGQFVMVRCGENTLLRRPLSIHQRDGDRIALLLAVVGRGTHWLSQRQAGDSIDVFGPLGNGFSIKRDLMHLLLIAGGIGVAPLYFLAQEAAREGHGVMLLTGVQTASQVYPQRLLPEGIRCITATEDGTVGYQGMITDLLPDFVDWADHVFACGPVPMYRNMANNYPKLKNKQVQISLEVRMGCGRGVCYGCTLKTRQGLKRVCQDGPVFDLDDILWDELVDI